MLDVTLPRRRSTNVFCVDCGIELSRKDATQCHRCYVKRKHESVYIDGKKLCSGCNQYLPATIEYFFRRGNKLSPKCKSCVALNIDPEANRNNTRKWRAEHPEEARESSNKSVQKWRESNPDGAKLASSLWRQRHPDRKRQTDRNTKAHRKGAKGRHDLNDIQLQIASQTDKNEKLHCWWCGKIIKGGYHVDHIIPLAHGGSNDAENICISCPPCNLSKHDKLPSEWKGRLL